MQAMSDLVKRLRAGSDQIRSCAYCNEAADRIEALEAAVANERERCIAICESWIGTFQKFDLKHISTRDYAVDVVEDIIALVRDGTDPLAPEQEQ
jgi:hypothetical protein